jgi:hypothetical protein
MTREEAKKELKPIKEMEADIRSVELEIERLMTIATKMTPNYEGSVQGSGGNRTEDAIIKIEEYRGRLSKLLQESLDYKAKCLNKVEKIYPRTLRTVLMFYYFSNNTMERTAELINHSYQWTYSMFQSALDEYCKISDSLDRIR